MQPYFFPYIGYFSLIKNVERFILLDEVQFIRHGWIERNRIMKPAQGWQYFAVPLQKHHRGDAIRGIHIDNHQPWKEKIVAQLLHYRKSAPFFQSSMDVIGDVFAKEWLGIAELNKAALESTCRRLGIGTSIEMFSQMKLALDPVGAPDEWALNICRALPGIDEYWNPPGGLAFFNRKKYESSGIQLKFHKICINEYDQRREAFEPGLSIIDVMMFNSAERIREMLDDYELL
jgi:hypothetical protein